MVKPYGAGCRQGAIHMVSAFSAANQVVLGQVKTDAKSNEITAIPELLELLSIRGCLVTIDAMGCQRAIAQKVSNKNVGYLLAVKGNQSKLEEAFNHYFRMEMFQCHDSDSYSTQESGHGRKETRLSLAVDDLSILGDLVFELAGAEDLRDSGSHTGSRRRTGQGHQGALLHQLSHAVGQEAAGNDPLPLVDRIPTALATGCGHAGRRLRIRSEQAGENMAVIRHIAFNALKADTSFKASMKRKQKRASQNNAYLSQVLAGLGVS